MRSTFKILFYVKKGSEKPNGNLPLMCRLTVDGEVKQFSCKMDVPPRLWDVKNSRATGKSLEAQKINAAVDRIRVDVNRHYQELMRSDGYVTASKLKDAYLGIGVKQETLVKLFEQHNVEFQKKVGHSRTKSTYSRYCTVCNHIKEFLQRFAVDFADGVITVHAVLAAGEGRYLSPELLITALRTHVGILCGNPTEESYRILRRSVLLSDGKTVFR